MKMKKKEPQGDTDELAEGLSALSLTQKENTEVHVSINNYLKLPRQKKLLGNCTGIECKTIESSCCTNCRVGSNNKRRSRKAACSA